MLEVFVRVVPLLFLSLPAYAAPPTVVQHQGRLLDGVGTPLEAPSGTPMTFRLYDVATGGTPLWTETESSVVVQGGAYSVVLGDGTPFPATAWDGGPRWLEVEVSGTVLSPRTPLASVPFSLTARDVRGGTVEATAVTVGGEPVATQADPGAGLCARLKQSTGTYTGPQFEAEAAADSGSTACGPGFHVCNYEEYATYAILGGCSLNVSWLVGGFSNINAHRRALWNGQDSTQCASGNLLTTYGKWGPYHGRVHCEPDTRGPYPLACCQDR